MVDRLLEANTTSPTKLAIEARHPYGRGIEGRSLNTPVQLLKVSGHLSGQIFC